MSIKSIAGGAAGQVAVIGIAGAALYYVYKQGRATVLRPVTPDVTNAYWDSSLGDLSGYALDWYTNGWGIGWGSSGPGSTIDEVQDYYNNGGLGTL